MNMKPPATRKQVHKLAGRLAALNRIIARSAEKGLPFFRIVRNTKHFEWARAAASFQGPEKLFNQINNIVQVFAFGHPVALSGSLAHHGKCSISRREGAQK